MRHNIATGALVQPKDIWKKAVSTKKRVQKFKGEIALQNLGGYVAKKREGSVAAQPKHRAVFGSEEYREKMRNRRQCVSAETAERMRTYWIGRKQDPEHVKKRIAAMKKTKAAKRAEWHGTIEELEGNR